MLTILDDIFPHLLSAFRIAEYNAYLRCWPDTRVYSTGASFRWVGETRGFQEVVIDYERHYPEFRSRVFHLSEYRGGRRGLLYTVFLNNAHAFLKSFEEGDTTFIFTLYPGGGFCLDDPASDAKLRTVSASPHLKKVIVTQTITREYLLAKGFCSADTIEFIYGGVCPADRLASGGKTPNSFGIDKGALDICFVANKYMPGGIDKGYDVFVEAARALSSRHDDIFFHVVGPYDEQDADVRGISGRIQFYGFCTTDFFPGFYSGMDIILSPNVPFVLQRGAFDGFPTGACMEAGLCGVALFCTDPLNLNIAFRDREEIVIIPHEGEGVVDLIEHYYSQPNELRALRQAGQRALRKVFDFDEQMAQRFQVLSDYLR